MYTPPGSSSTSPLLAHTVPSSSQAWLYLRVFALAVYSALKLFSPHACLAPSLHLGFDPHHLIKKISPTTLLRSLSRLLFYLVFLPSIFLKNKFIYLFILAALGLRCCLQAFSSCGEPGVLFVAVHGLLIVVAFLCCGARALGTRAQ